MGIIDELRKKKAAEEAAKAASGGEAEKVEDRINPPEKPEPTQADLEGDKKPEEVTAPEPAKEEEPKKRTRRTKAQMEADEAAAKEPGVAAENGPEMVSVDVPRGYGLLINCVQDGGPQLPISKVYEAVHEKIRTEGVPDYTAVEYGKGTGMFLEYFRDALDQVLSAHVGLVFTCDTSAREWSIVSSYLTAKAVYVIRGVR